MNPIFRIQSRPRRWLAALLGAGLGATVSWAQTTATTTTASSAAAATGENASSVVKMSPFTVQASSSDVGYYAENTLAGSRLNTNISDLASSITIVTKQQLEDTASIDINDVFMYEANTEGSNTYTELDIDRGVARDPISGSGTSTTFATNNRVRGLASVDTAENNYPTLRSIPFDAYNTNTVEINRGPNSLLFGTGSPAGIVNQSTATAVLGKRASEVQYRFGSFGSYRGSFNTNQPLGHKAAVFAAALYNDDAYERKPSYNTTRRQYIAFSLEPTSSTQITADYEHYDNHASLPNYVAPIDYVTPWMQAGRPAYNPYTSMLTILDTGKVMGPYVFDTHDPRYVKGMPTGTTALTNTTSPLYVPTIGFDGHNKMFFDGNTKVGFWEPGPSTVAYNRPATSAMTAAQLFAYSQELTNSIAPPPPTPDPSTGANIFGTWYYPAITNPSLYDWTRVSIDSANISTQKADTYHIELQQRLPWGFNFDFGWFRQELKSLTNRPLGDANNPLAIYVDTNQVNLDGTPNPYFGSPFVNNYQSTIGTSTEINNNFRAMLAWEHDFTKNANWTRWFGRHRILGFWTRQQDDTYSMTYAASFDGGDPRLLPNTNTNPANNYAWEAQTNFWRDYYIGHNANGVIQYSPAVGGSGFGMGDQSIRTWNWLTNTYDDASVHLSYNLRAGGPINLKIDDARSLAWQGYLWNDRILPTIGWRRDDLSIAATSLTGLATYQEYQNGYAIPGLEYRLGSTFYLAGNTKTSGVVVKPLKGWSGIENAANSGSVLADLARGLNFHVNKSDNFTPPGGVQYDFFDVPLGKPSGQGKDWGVGMSMFHNKLYLNLNWYEATDENAPSSAAGTPIGRIERIDTSSFRSWATYVVRIRDGQDPTSSTFNNNTTTPLTQADQDAIAKIMGLPFTWPTYSVAGTQSDKANGMEASLVYNPVPNWTMKLDVGKQQSTYSDVAKQITDWLAVRMPIWTSAQALDMPASFNLSSGTPVSMQHFWTGYGFNADALQNNPNGWTSVQGFYNAAVLPTIFTAIAGQNTKVPNEREWQSNFITNYAFTHGWLRGVSVGGAFRWADKAIAGYYGSTDPSTYAHPAPGQTVMVLPDLNRPIYTPAEHHLDLWLAYTTELPAVFGQHVRAKFQLNVRDVTENGGLLPILFNMDGSPASYRIKDPRTYYFTTTLYF